MNEKRAKKLLEAEAKLKDYPFPKQIVIETTTRCDLKCTMCAHRIMKRPKGRMEMPLYKKIIHEIAEEAPDTEVWMTFYGEALLLGYRLFYQIWYAKQQGLTNVVLNTNAQTMNAEKREWLLDSGLDVLIFSMDAFSKETYESIRVGGSYERMKENVEAIIELNRERGGHLNIICQFSIMNENEHEADAFFDYWMSRGAGVKMREKFTWTGDVDAPNLDREVTRIACPWIVKTCAIHYNGDIVTCAADYEGKFKTGNVNEKTIGEIWRTTHKQLRQQHLSHQWDQLPEICQQCIDWQAIGARIYDPETGKLINRF